MVLQGFDFPNQQKSMTPIPYEILRRTDGAMALSVSVGSIPFEPSQISLGKVDGLIFSADGKECVCLCALPPDVMAYVALKGGLPLLEFGPLGLFASHALVLSHEGWTDAGHE